VIVVDASALAAFILKEPGWRQLARHLKRCISVDHVVKEVANAIWKAAKVRGFLDSSTALKLYDILERLIGVNITLEPETRYTRRALEVALETGLTVYDALYIALAEDKGLPLLTLDEKQAKAASRLGVPTVTL
jgi:predicted nucleic acid-binding protein